MSIAQIRSRTPAPTGLMDRQGPPAAGYTASIKGFVINVRWADLQPARYGPLNLDCPINMAGTSGTFSSYLATAVSGGMQVRIRVMCGVHAPEWVKTLDGPAIVWGGPSDSPDNDGVPWTMGRWWKPTYLRAYYDLQFKLSAMFDAHPNVGSVVIGNANTVYAEPFIRQTEVVGNRQPLVDSGYTATKDLDAIIAGIDIHNTLWLRTESTLAINPWDHINQDANGALQTPHTFGDYTSALAVAKYGRRLMGARFAFGNHSMKDTGNSSALESLYSGWADIGAPSYIQTDIPARIGNLDNVLARCVSMDVSCVELPISYSGSGSFPLAAITTTQAATRDTALRGVTRWTANQGADRPTPSVVLAQAGLTA